MKDSVRGVFTATKGWQAMSTVSDADLKLMWGEAVAHDEPYAKCVLASEIRDRVREKETLRERFCGVCGKAHAPVCGYSYSLRSEPPVT